jgi:hypothetical protein
VKDKLTPLQTELLRYMRGLPFTSPTDIGRGFWGPPHHSSTASPVLLRLVKLGLVSRNKRGWYREAHANGE